VFGTRVTGIETSLLCPRCMVAMVTGSHLKRKICGNIIDCFERL
jgi:hypothetical protein